METKKVRGIIFEIEDNEIPNITAFLGDHFTHQRKNYKIIQQVLKEENSSKSLVITDKRYRASYLNLVTLQSKLKSVEYLNLPLYWQDESEPHKLLTGNDKHHLAGLLEVKRLAALMDSTHSLKRLRAQDTFEDVERIHKKVFISHDKAAKRDFLPRDQYDTITENYLIEAKCLLEKFNIQTFVSEHIFKNLKAKSPLIEEFQWNWNITQENDPPKKIEEIPINLNFIANTWNEIKKLPLGFENRTLSLPSQNENCYERKTSCSSYQDTLDNPALTDHKHNNRNVEDGDVLSSKPKKNKNLSALRLIDLDSTSNFSYVSEKENDQKNINERVESELEKNIQNPLKDLFTMNSEVEHTKQVTLSSSSQINEETSLSDWDVNQKSPTKHLSDFPKRAQEKGEEGEKGGYTLANMEVKIKKKRNLSQLSSIDLDNPIDFSYVSENENEQKNINDFADSDLDIHFQQNTLINVSTGIELVSQINESIKENSEIYPRHELSRPLEIDKEIKEEGFAFVNKVVEGKLVRNLDDKTAPKNEKLIASLAIDRSPDNDSNDDDGQSYKTVVRNKEDNASDKLNCETTKSVIKQNMKPSDSNSHASSTKNTIVQTPLEKLAQALQKQLARDLVAEEIFQKQFDLQDPKETQKFIERITIANKRDRFFKMIDQNPFYYLPRLDKERVSLLKGFLTNKDIEQILTLKADKNL